MKIAMTRAVALCGAELEVGQVVAEVELPGPLNLVTLVDAVRNGMAAEVPEATTTEGLDGPAPEPTTLEGQPEATGEAVPTEDAAPNV